MEAGAVGVKRPGHFCLTPLFTKWKLPSQVQVIRAGAAGRPAV